MPSSLVSSPIRSPLPRSRCSALRFSLALAGALAVIPACGGEDAPASPPDSNGGAAGAGGVAQAGSAGVSASPPPGSIPGLPDNFCDGLLDKLAADLLARGRINALEQRTYKLAKLDACRGFARTMGRAIARGDATFDAAVFAAAVSGPPGDLCRRESVSPRYRGMFVGRVEEGGRCVSAGFSYSDSFPVFLDDTCVVGTRCEEPDDSCGLPRCVRESTLGEPCALEEARCAEGLVCRDGVGPVLTCQAPAPAGDACDRDIDCLADQWPGIYAGTLSCFSTTGGKICVAAQPNGAACGPIDTCPSCSSADLCAGGACVEGKCTDAAPVGAPCKDKSAVCGAALRCIVDPAHPAGACLAVARVGEACSSDAVCGPSLDCVAGICDFGSPAGAACADGGCGRGLFCQAGSCTARRALGETCDPDEDGCELGSACEPALFRCVRPGDAPGVACSPAGAGCEAGLSCGPKVCVEVLFEGDPCKIETDCPFPLSCIAGVCRDTCK